MTHRDTAAEARVQAALERLAEQGPGVDLPQAHQLYWRARVLERFAARRQAEVRATRPLDVARWMAGVLVALVAAAAAVRLLLRAAAESVFAGMGGTLGSGLGTATGDLPAAVTPATGLLLAVGAALLAAALAAGLYGLVREP
jgi:hypothetical protein